MEEMKKDKNSVKGEKVGKKRGKRDVEENKKRM